MKNEKSELKDVKPYQAPKHFNMTALRLHGKEETGSKRFWMGLSHFLPEEEQSLIRHLLKKSILF